MTCFLCADKKSVSQEGYYNPRKDTPSRSKVSSSFKTQQTRQGRNSKQFRQQLKASSGKGRNDTPSRSKVSSSFKTQQTGQGRILKADSNGSQQPGHEAEYKLTTLLYFVLLFLV
jgi:hypothetical protein